MTAYVRYRNQKTSNTNVEVLTDLEFSHANNFVLNFRSYLPFYNWRLLRRRSRFRALPIHRDVCRNSAEFFAHSFFPDFFIRNTRPVFPDGRHVQHRMCLYTSEFIRNNAVILARAFNVLVTVLDVCISAADGV